MKVLCVFFQILFLTTVFSSAQTRENRYDVLGKIIEPFAQLFVQSPTTSNLAWESELKLLEMTDLPPEFAGIRMRIAVQKPDKALLQIFWTQENWTICRNGRSVWIYPGAKAESLFANLDLPPSDTSYRLQPFRLPIPEKQLVFLPALFQIKDMASDGTQSRHLYLTLMPELARSLKIEDWWAELWVSPEYHPVQIKVANPKWQILVGFENTRYAKSLPPETWMPSEAQKEDVFKLDEKQFKQLLDWVVKQTR